MKRGILLLWMIMLIGLKGQSQSTTGINGKVTDESSKPIYRASVHLLNTAMYEFTDENGLFSFANVPQGKYTIEVSAAGYASMATMMVLSSTGQQLDFKLLPVSMQLESVTVTADKKETLLQKQPSSVTAITAQQLQQYRLWNAKDISGIVPGLYSGNSGDDRNVTSIRGITTTSYDPAVATYIDGVNQFSLDTYIPQLNDIERIEVLRGPQGTLYGRNAMGGVINIITKQPTNNTNGFVELSLGNYRQQRVSAAIRTPIVKDKLFFGASGLFNARKGFYTNEFNNRSFDKQDGFTGNYFLKYLPGDGWSFTLNAKHQNNQNDGAFAMVFGLEDALNNPFKLNQNAVSTMVDNTMNASLSIHRNGTSIDFTSLTAFQNNRRYYNKPLDGDFSPLDGVTIINDYGNKWNNVKVLTQEFRLSSANNKSSKLNWTAGTYLFLQDNPVKQATHYGEDAGMLGAPAINFSTINTSEANNAGIAFFGQLNYALTEKLSLFGGLRYDYEHKSLKVKGEYQNDGDDAVVIRPDTTGKVDFSAFSPKLGLQYQLSANSNVYGSFSRGYRTGGLTQLSSDPSQPPLYPYKPEYSNNFEIGIKNTLLNNKLFINAAAFVTYLTDAQVPTLVLPDAITITRNTGSLNSKGLELELTTKPAKGLQFDYTAGYTDASYKSLKVSSNGQTVDLDGKKQIFTPDLTSMLAAQYSYTVSDKHQLRLIARAEWFYFGEKYFDLANTMKQSPYHLLNTRLGVSSRHAELYFWVRNMGNETYIEYAYDFGAVHLANPRTYGVTLRANF
ncbi:MAG: TonB-dependent receptor [Bacteroidota bacterium]